MRLLIHAFMFVLAACTGADSDTGITDSAGIQLVTIQASDSGWRNG